jgi:hypothetical protein
LIPKVSFFGVDAHLKMLEEMLEDWNNEEHLLLIGNQGEELCMLLFVTMFIKQKELERTFLQTSCYSCCVENANTYKCIATPLFSLSLSRQN